MISGDEEEIEDIWADRSPTGTKHLIRTKTPEEVVIPEEEKEEEQEEIEDIWADKSPEYMAATPTYIKNQIDKNVKALQMKVIPPVRLNQDLLTGLQVALSRSNSCKPHDDEDETNTNSNSSTKAYQKLKENPLYNDDMSINLNELAKISLKDEKRSLKSKIKSCPTNPLSDSPYSPQDLSYCSISSQNSSTPFSSNSNNNSSDYQNAKESNFYNTNNKTANETNKNSYLPQFSRSAVGGSKFLTNCHPYNPEEYDGLEFESRFESGNLAKAIQITPTYYELYLRPDLYTSRSKQWFYFRVKRTKKNMIYR